MNFQNEAAWPASKTGVQSQKGTHGTQCGMEGGVACSKTGTYAMPPSTNSPELATEDSIPAGRQRMPSPDKDPSSLQELIVELDPDFPEGSV